MLNWTTGHDEVCFKRLMSEVLQVYFEQLKTKISNYSMCNSSEYCPFFELLICIFLCILTITANEGNLSNVWSSNKCLNERMMILSTSSMHNFKLKAYSTAMTQYVITILQNTEINMKSYNALLNKACLEVSYELNFYQIWLVSLMLFLSTHI